MSKASGLLPGSNARVYRDGAPGEGVHEATVGVPQDRPLELRNLQPGTYAVQDEAGNVEEFTVSAFAESAWVPVQGVEPVALGADSEIIGKGGKRGTGHAPLSELAARPAVVDPDTVRVPGAPGSAHVGDPPDATGAKAQPNTPSGKRPRPRKTHVKPAASSLSAGKRAAKAAEEPGPKRSRAKAAQAPKPEPQSAESSS